MNKSIDKTRKKRQQRIVDGKIDDDKRFLYKSRQDRPPSQSSKKKYKKGKNGRKNED